jgi:mono/diheme cytochrome c family protein
MVPPVLAVAAFVAFWVIVALGLVYVAMRRQGGMAGLRRTGRGANTGVGAVFVVIAVAFGIALPLVMLTGNHAKANGQVGGIKLTAAEKIGRETFGDHCAVCHTLSAASASGKVGPNLDLLKPSEPVVLHTIANGCLPNAPSSSAQACLGQGVMPANVVTGRAATDVAMFVAKVAGNE